MKVSYLSDIHADFYAEFHKNQTKWEKRTRDFIVSLVETDKSDREVLIVAGDISHFNQQSLWILDEFSKHYSRVIFNFGNHDFYLVSKNQENKYKKNSMNRVLELYEESKKIDGVHPLFFGEVVEYKGFKFGGCSLWYPLETFEQQNFFRSISNDSKLIKGVDIQRQHHVDQQRYELLLKENLDVMISHFPVINVDSHFKYNSTACYLTPVKDINVNHFIFGHSHEQKVYDKGYCKFYMNAQGYPEEDLKLGIKSFNLIK